MIEQVDKVENLSKVFNFLLPAGGLTHDRVPREGGGDLILEYSKVLEEKSGMEILGAVIAAVYLAGAADSRKVTKWRLYHN